MRTFRGIRDLDPQRVERITKSGSGAKAIWPRWEKTTTETQDVFRLLPVVDPETGKLAPYRLSGEYHDFGPWLFATYVATIGGPRGTSFIAADIRQHRGADIQTTPYFMLYSKVRNAVQFGSKPEWRDYNLVRISQDDTTVPLLLPPELKYMSMCFVASHYEYALRDRLYGVDPSDPIFVVILTRLTGMRLMDRLETSDNISLDITNPAGGAFVRVYQSVDPAQRGYDIAILRNYNKLSPVLPQSAYSKFCWWDDVLHFPSAAEQIRLMYDCGVPADVLYYVFSGTEYEQYIPACAPSETNGAIVPEIDPSSTVFTSTLDISEEIRQGLAEAEARRRRRTSS